MIIHNIRALDLFSVRHSETRKSLAAWKQITETAFWRMKRDVLSSFPNAKMIKNNRARFEINHNKYRLIAEVFYEDLAVEIRFIGSHTEYDRIDPATI